ncbi:MAG TPA: hypothetical protein PKD53_16465 [Chloroflexaceae bacterium]|nr:hypothetical protein [Chloroflexaceae bacterium]
MSAGDAADQARGGEPLFVVPEGEPLLAAVERGLREGGPPLHALPALSDLAARDPFLARELAALHAGWELRPGPARGLVARLRSRLAWWLLGPELGQASAYHAHLARVIDSLTAHLDAERAARAGLEARLRALEAER